MNLQLEHLQGRRRRECVSREDVNENMEAEETSVPLLRPRTGGTRLCRHFFTCKDP